MAENIAVQRLIESKASDELLEKVSWKKNILSAKKLFEATAQAPSPSKDFTQIVITEQGVVWRRWKISLRGVSRGAAPTPYEEFMTHEDFLYSDSLEGDVEHIFGGEVLRQIKRILAGSHDELSCLPEKLAVNIFTYLDLQSVAQLSQVNRHLRLVCNSDALWEKLYCSHQGTPSNEVAMLAKEVGWKTVFFMSKLQLQKELSRRRKVHPPPLPMEQSGSDGRQSPSSTFLTQGY